MSLVGKCIFYFGDKYHMCGEVMDQTGEYVLVKWDRLNGEPGAHDNAAVLIAISALATKPGKDAVYEFFATRQQMEAYRREIGCFDEDETASGADDMPAAVVKLN
jgi:hypothetical protein